MSGGKSQQSCPKRKGTIAVIFTRSDSGEPIQGASVSVQGPTPGMATTDKLGAVVLKDRAPGAYTASITLPPSMKGYGMTLETKKGSVAAGGSQVLLFKAAPVGNLHIDLYDERGQLVTEEAQLAASGPSSPPPQTGKTGSHTFTNIPAGTYQASASVSAAFFEAPTVSVPGVVVPAGGTANARLEVKRRINVVTPKIEMEYKVVLRDRGLSSHQHASEKPILADDVTYIRLSASQSTGRPGYTGDAIFEVSPANVAVYLDRECKRALSGKISNKDLLGGKCDLYLKGRSAGKFSAKLTLDPPNHPNIEIKPPAQEEMGVVELEAKVHAYLRSDLEGIKVNPDVEPVADYHTALKDEKLPDQKPLSDADKVNAGRLLHVQSKDNAHARAKVVLQQLVAGHWPDGTDDYDVTVGEDKGGGSVQLFDKETDGSEIKLPHTVKVKDLKAKALELWVQGKGRSEKLRDVVLQLGLDRARGGLAKEPKRKADWSRFTVVKIQEVRIVYQKAKDEHAAWDEAKKRFYININQKGDPDGRKLTVSAQLSDKLEGVPIRFMLAPDEGNAKQANWNIDFPANAKSGGTDVKWKDIPAGLKHVDRKTRDDLLHLVKESDKDGYAEIELQLSRFGGDKFHPGCYIEQDPHLAKYVHGHAELGKLEPAFCKPRPVQVWRKVFYQATRPKATSMPASAGFDASQRKVFLEPLAASEKVMTKRHFTVDPFRPDWQFNAQGTRTQKLCIGTHNVDDAMNLFVAPTKASTPKFHVVLCDEQFDAKDTSGNDVQSDAEIVVFDAAHPGPQDVEMTSSSVEAGYLTILKPPLQGGDLIVSGTWEALDGAGTVEHSGTLAAAGVALRRDRATKSTVRVTPPTRCAGAAGGCVCGNPPTALAIDANHSIEVTLQLLAADGGYNGWAPRGHPASVVKGGRAAYAIHNTMAHEMGHLFGKVRTASIPGLPDHPKFYERRGGSGPHCAFDAAFTADPSAPVLNPATPGQRDAQGKGAGRWDSGKCIIFGYTRNFKREWCEHCALDFILSDLSEFR